MERDTQKRAWRPETEAEWEDDSGQTDTVLERHTDRWTQCRAWRNREGQRDTEKYARRDRNGGGGER